MWRRGSSIDEQRGSIRVTTGTFNGLAGLEARSRRGIPELSNLRNTGYRG